MKYLKLFDTESNYLAYRDGDSYLKPNVSLSDDKGSVYYNFTPPPIVYEAVDLGLPSGTKWAAQNVGARKPSDSGFYFQWGDTEGYAFDQVGTDKQFASDWSDYKWYLSGSNDDINSLKFTKYTTTGATLELEDDAAHVHMGGDWHMPTPTQIQELLNNTFINIWATQDGINGILFTSTSDSSKSIFIPTAGYAYDGLVRYSGAEASVWSSMLSTRYVAAGLFLASDTDDTNLKYTSRHFGFSVRGVIG